MAVETAAVRRWARERGMPVGDRGRLSPDLVRAYEAEHGLASAPAQRRQSSRAAARKQQPPSGNGRVVHARTPWDWPRRG